MLWSDPGAYLVVLGRCEASKTMKGWRKICWGGGREEAENGVLPAWSGVVKGSPGVENMTRSVLSSSDPGATSSVEVWPNIVDPRWHSKYLLHSIRS